MDKEEVFNQITSQFKWYAGYCSEQQAYNLKKRFKAGTLTHETMAAFFNHFGYTLNTITWQKIR